MKKSILLLKKSGFTLIELLVVVAIIGILATLATIGLSSSRAKAKIVSAQSTMGSILPIANSCLDDAEVLNSPNDTTLGGGEICDGVETNWPEITPGWTYGSPTSDISSHVFTYSVSDTLGNSIECSANTDCVLTLAE